MKKNYMKPVMRVVELDNADIIATSMPIDGTFTESDENLVGSRRGDWDDYEY